MSNKHKNWQQASKPQPKPVELKEEPMPQQEPLVEQNPHEQAHVEPTVSVQQEPPAETLEQVLLTEPEPTPTFEIGVAPIEIDMEAQKKLAESDEMVPIIPRKNMSRSRIGGQWYTLVKGREVFVPRAVADHLFEKGIL